MKSKEINEPKKNISHLENINSFPQNNIPHKSSNLLELLKARKGQNINIDISMLSNKGSLTNLIEKAKKYQIYPKPKNIQNNVNEKKIETVNIKPQKDESLKENVIKNSKKISNQIELLEKFSKIMNKNEKSIENHNEENPENEKDIDNYKRHQKKNSQSPSFYNVLSYKTSSSGTRTKSDQISNKEKSENLSQQGQEQEQEQEEYISEEIESNSSNKELSKNLIKNNIDINIENNANYNYQNKKGKKNKNKSNKTQNNINYKENFSIEYETVKDNYSIKSCNIVLEYSFREAQNIDSQANMEDKSKSIENFNNNKNQMLFELFDGHGGEEISNFLQQNFAQIYKQYLEINNYDIPKSLSDSFKEADDMIKESINNLDGMGSTGTILHLSWEENSRLMVYSANVGDSRVSLISPNHIIRLSYDHRMSDEKERKRILDAGIEVEENRIGGELMLTRIFGDYEFKDEKNKNGVICEPFLSKIKIDLNIRDQFLILASDGIWDLVNEKEIQQMIKKYNNSEKLCAMIIKKALDKGSWDNMSVFAIRLT